MRSFGFFLSRTGLYVFAFPLLVFAVGGCNKSTGNVSGKVSYKGKPLEGGYINFMSEGEKSVIKTSEIKADGSYAVSGLPVGMAKISVQGLSPRALSTPPSMLKKLGEKGEKISPVKQKEVYVPPQYGNSEQSGLKYEVKSGTQSYDIDLK